MKVAHLIGSTGLYGAERLATRLHNQLESADGVPVADMICWCHPSAELVAESREVLA